MKKLVCYYAHPMTTYGSTIETQDVETLEALGFEVINPNSPKYQQKCKDYIAEFGKVCVMDYFINIIKDQCNLVAFRALPDGRILSGVATEIWTAKHANMPIIELARSLDERSMNYPETKRYLTEAGHYKE